MDIICLVGSAFGSKTRIAINYTVRALTKEYPQHKVTLVDLADYDIQFSDGRNYLDYEGDTGTITRQIMESDAIIIGTPIFQASIPGTLKNIFDLLPVNALRDKVVSMLAIAGSPKHYLIVEQQLKPILGFMKAQIVQTYIFIEEIDFRDKKIVNDDILFRIDRLVEDTITLTEGCQNALESQEDEYDF